MLTRKCQLKKKINFLRDLSVSYYAFSLTTIVRVLFDLVDVFSNVKWK